MMPKTLAEHRMSFLSGVVKSGLSLKVELCVQECIEVIKHTSGEYEMVVDIFRERFFIMPIDKEAQLDLNKFINLLQDVKSVFGLCSAFIMMNEVSSKCYDYDEVDVTLPDEVIVKLKELCLKCDSVIQEFQSMRGEGTEKKYRYNVTCSGEDDNEGVIELTEREALIVAYATNGNNWKHRHYSVYGGVFKIDIEHPKPIKEDDGNRRLLKT